MASIFNLESKNSDSLSRNISNDDFDLSLPLHATSYLKVNKEMGQDTSLFAKKLENTLQALGMSVIVQFERVGMGLDGDPRLMKMMHN